MADSFKGQLVGVEAIVLASITTYEDGTPDYFGFSFRIVDTKSGVVIWTGNHSLHSGPISVPDTLDSLVPYTIRELIDQCIASMNKI